MSSIGVVVAVVVAAGVGGICRYGLARQLNDGFPLGTLAANVVASGMLAFLVGWNEVSDLVLGLGFAGSLSTWSTLANEIVDLASTKRTRLACVYLAVSLAAGVSAALVGLQLGSQI